MCSAFTLPWVASTCRFWGHRHHPCMQGPGDYPQLSSSPMTLSPWGMHSQWVCCHPQGANTGPWDAKTPYSLCITCRYPYRAESVYGIGVVLKFHVGRRD